MCHDGVGLGGGMDNCVKFIQTRSGYRVVFTEDESIIMTDKSVSEIHLDTTGSNINITSPETMTLNCKNMNDKDPSNNVNLITNKISLWKFQWDIMRKDSNLII